VKKDDFAANERGSTPIRQSQVVLLSIYLLSALIRGHRSKFVFPQPARLLAPKGWGQDKDKDQRKTRRASRALALDKSSPSSSG
jgi:hypothetical protein